MSARLRKWKRVWASFSGAVLLAAAETSAWGQAPCDPCPPTHWTPAPQVVPTWYCPQGQPPIPLPSPAPVPSATPSPSPTPAPSQTPSQTPGQTPSPPPEQAPAETPTPDANFDA